MKYIISESKIDQLMIKYFEKQFNPEKVEFYYPIETDEFTGEEYEDTNRIVFFKGEYDDDENEDILFRYYQCEYFDNPETIDCPILQLETKYFENLSGLFGNIWIELFKKWVKENFNLEPKVVE